MSESSRKRRTDELSLRGEKEPKTARKESESMRKTERKELESNAQSESTSPSEAVEVLDTLLGMLSLVDNNGNADLSQQVHTLPSNSQNLTLHDVTNQDNKGKLESNDCQKGVQFFTISSNFNESADENRRNPEGQSAGGSENIFYMLGQHSERFNMPNVGNVDSNKTSCDDKSQCKK